MLVRVAVVAGTCVLGAIAAKAEELGPEQARAFVVGKLFSYTCFDGNCWHGPHLCRRLGGRHHPARRPLARCD